MKKITEELNNGQLKLKAKREDNLANSFYKLGMAQANLQFQKQENEQTAMMNTVKQAQLVEQEISMKKMMAELGMKLDSLSAPAMGGGLPPGLGGGLPPELAGALGAPPPDLAGSGEGLPPEMTGGMGMPPQMPMM